MCQNRFLNVKALKCAFNKEKTLVGAFFVSVIVKSSRTFVSGSIIDCLLLVLLRMSQM